MARNAFDQMARTLTGATSAARFAAPAVAEATERVLVAELILRQYGGDAAVFVANALYARVRYGGDLNKLLGLRVARGRSVDMPHRAEAKRRRDQRVILESERLRQSDPGMTDTEVARLLALAFRDPVRQAQLREEVGVCARFPTSKKTVLLILREHPR